MNAKVICTIFYINISISMGSVDQYFYGINSLEVKLLNQKHTDF